MEKKDVTATINAAGRTIFYVDGKRRSYKDAATVCQDIAAKKFFDAALGFDCSYEGKYVIKICGHDNAPIENALEFYGYENTTRLDWEFFSGAETISDALKLAAIALTVPRVTHATIHLSLDRGQTKGKGWLYSNDHISVTARGVLMCSTSCRIYQSVVDELAAQGFQSVVDCEAAWQEATDLLEQCAELERRKNDACHKAWGMTQARDKAVKEYVQSLIA